MSVTGLRNLALAAGAAAAGFFSATSAFAQSGSFTLHGETIRAGEAIPLRHSAYGENVSPGLSWHDLPEGTRSLALVMDDPDAPTPQPFVHWVVYNIPAAAAGLPEGLPADPVLTVPPGLAGVTQGPAAMRRAGYFGPRPPAGRTHNYVFTLYALDMDPELPEGLGKDQLLERIRDHVLGEAGLVAPFQRPE